MTAPAAPTVSLGFGIKELRLSWAAVSGADYYRMLENPDGTSGYTQVGANLTTLSVTHTIPLHRRLNASYIVEACNSAGCTGSAAQILGATLTQAIGYMKASPAGSFFGFSVALSGDGTTLAVGGGHDGEGGGSSETVFVFTLSGTTWSQQASVKASNPGPDIFGYSVGLSADGNTLAVGAYCEDSGTNGIGSTPNESAICAGAAYVFTRSGTTWSEQAYVKASNTGAGDYFGTSVALSGDGNTLAVGAVGEDSSSAGIGSAPNESAVNAGAVYVFTRSGTMWSQQAYVKASNTRTQDLFGRSVALSSDGNTLAVGACCEDSSTTGVGSTPDILASGAGAVYVFTRSSTATWSEQAYVKASNTGAGDNFGRSVALSGDGNTLAVGAPLEDSSTTGIGSTPNESAADAGAAYVFTRSAGIWSQKAYVKASNTGAGDFFGCSVALSADGNTLAVGADGEDSSTTGVGSTPNESASAAGAVYLY